MSTYLEKLKREVHDQALLDYVSGLAARLRELEKFKSEAERRLSKTDWLVRNVEELVDHHNTVQERIKNLK